MENLEFTDEEVKDQLEALGYYNVSKDRILQFKQDLHRLIESDQSSESQSWITGSSGTDLDNSSFYQSHHHKQPPRTATTSSYQPHIKPKTSHLQKTKLCSYPSAAISNPNKKNVNYNSSIGTDEDPSFSQSETTSTNLSPLKAAIKGRGYISEKIIESGESTVAEDSVSETSSAEDRKVLQKRKVARRLKDGTSRIYDESLVHDENMGVYRCHDLSSCDDSDPRLMRTTTPFPLPPRPQSARPMGKRMENHQTQLPSFIRPDVYPKNLAVKKEDPVEKFGHYKRVWANSKIPCEGNHKALRWQIKAQMLYKEELAPKPQRVYVPNTYVVPTSKKRSALRWEVRHALARGIRPETGPFELY